METARHQPLVSAVAIGTPARTAATSDRTRSSDGAWSGLRKCLEAPGSNDVVWRTRLVSGSSEQENRDHI